MSKLGVLSLKFTQFKSDQLFLPGKADTKRNHQLCDDHSQKMQNSLDNILCYMAVFLLIYKVPLDNLNQISNKKLWADIGFLIACIILDLVKKAMYFTIPKKTTCFIRSPWWVNRYVDRQIPKVEVNGRKWIILTSNGNSGRKYFCVFSPVSNISKPKYTGEKKNHLLIWIVISTYSGWSHSVLLLLDNTGFQLEFGCSDFPN